MSADLDSSVNLFLAIRPYYEPSHVREIAERMDAEQVPFCRTCADWHFTSEDHSLTD